MWVSSRADALVLRSENGDGTREDQHGDDPPVGPDIDGSLPLRLIAKEQAEPASQAPRRDHQVLESMTRLVGWLYVQSMNVQWSIG
jgi:hypothetical protein